MNSKDDLSKVQKLLLSYLSYTFDNFVYKTIKFLVSLDKFKQFY